jgi:hypothetical protein
MNTENPTDSTAYYHHHFVTAPTNMSMRTIHLRNECSGSSKMDMLGSSSSSSHSISSISSSSLRRMNSLCSSSLSSSMHNARRTVRFCPIRISVQFTLTIDELTTNERNAVWYSRSEFKSMQKSLSKAAKTAGQQSILSQQSLLELYGIESSTHRLQCHKRVQRYISLIISEQDRQWKKELKDSFLMASWSQFLTQTSRDSASIRGTALATHIVSTTANNTNHHKNSKQTTSSDKILHHQRVVGEGGGGGLVQPRHKSLFCLSPASGETTNTKLSRSPSWGDKNKNNIRWTTDPLSSSSSSSVPSQLNHQKARGRDVMLMKPLRS